MPCPANELGVVEPFVAIENSKANTGTASCESMAGDCLWRVRARHAVPLLKKRQRRRPEASGTKSTALNGAGTCTLKNNWRCCALAQRALLRVY